MALATTCPQCKTSFRVVPDQLKLRRGYVRCGRCRHVFAGVDHLRYIDDAQLRAEARATGAERRRETDAVVEPEPDGAAITDDVEWIVVGAPDSDDAPLAEPFDDEARAVPTPDEAREESPADSPEKETAPADAPIGETSVAEASIEAPEAPFAEERFTEAPFSEEPFAEEPFAEAPFLEAPESEPPAKEASPTETSADAPAAEEGLDEPPPPYVERYADAAYDERGGDESAIDYFSTGRARGFADRRGLAAGLLALVLALTLAMQSVVAQRSAIASNLPFAAPLLGAVLAPFGLRIEAPRELDALTIESFELHASAAPDVLEMRALLRNRADHPVRWPSMQLTLTDPSSRVLVRHALHPDDYLPQDDEARNGGVPPSTEWPLRLALEASELQATGYDYRVQLFYSQERR
ncbi:MAG: DUF3426 domain-containing protein [Burkholderiaceae bacterium]|jgi:predicted Zn finger-like uncharacterized protein|nr:DUF3426 domain-containing protein [Burkholderiaceae bacterium]